MQIFKKVSAIVFSQTHNTTIGVNQNSIDF